MGRAPTKPSHESNDPSRGRAKVIGSPAAGPTKLSQREKFIQTAREIGADETGEALDEALRTIGRARRRPAP